MTSRRLIGYGKLLKSKIEELVNENKFHLCMDELCINNSIVNHAFVNMLDWHPGLREDEKPFLE
ncbi:hypothetical protein J5Y03_06975 [Bacillus sp. RG28]|uniref:Uncharacterized protein n=1 Tax=Gottfriedia endophytica TaxID=2820819 RepID=A0A940NQB4_9BACI|nr:hypothetical protein [Gottfriedia endophytica]MBP0724931.1 hypothetical protein [Gottfriedia endophytica]